MAKPKPKYYVVWKGKEPGIFDSWDTCKKQIQNFTGAQYKSFKTKEAAESAFKLSYKDAIISPLTPLSTRRGEEGEVVGYPMLESISVDAAFNGKVMEYKGVYTKTKQELFKLGPFEDATNNIGEFLAIVHALGYLKKQHSTVPVYSDSVTAIHWVKTHKANTKLKETPANKSLFFLIERAEKWLSQNKYPNKLLKWETKAWGENPADFGRK
ncbi:MAG: ribonuclease H family protein [Bacteroidetes bacterium]|nr:ribonuclease H family protein [Bacteroidota bacterium]